MKELYNAKTAREYSMIYRYKDEIEAVNNKIGEAVVKGETSCEYYDTLSSFVKDTFEDLGYTIDTDSSSWTDSGFITYIKW
jgi:predicted hydrocarbon binding protein